MTIGGSFPNSRPLILLLLPLIFATAIPSVYATCQLSFEQDNKLYNYSLTNPIRNFPHGILSEDGFYKVAVNGTVLWFQLCDAMIFNHDPPTCVECVDCVGISRCGMGCSALVANTVGGYPVCTTLGYSSSTSFELIDKKDPLKGITAKLSNRGPKLNCSLVVSIVCDTNGVQGPQTLELVGTCDYFFGARSVWRIRTQQSLLQYALHAQISLLVCRHMRTNNLVLSSISSLFLTLLTLLRTLFLWIVSTWSSRFIFCWQATQMHHPSGCALVISFHGHGMGWFGTMLIIILFFFGVYLLGGAVYRYYSLGIRGIDIIPNLEFWASLPHTLQSSFISLVRRFRGSSHGHRSSYSPVNF